MLFDNDRSNSISFEEFLQGISKFIKQDKDTKIFNLFKLYDLDNNGLIEKTEFQKMLYNYPQDDIETVIAVLQSFAPHYVFNPLTQSHQKRITDSNLNLKKGDFLKRRGH